MPVTQGHSRVTLREAWLTWKVHHAEFQTEVYRVEVNRLQAKIQRETDSVWKKTKAELIEMARQELGMTWATAEKNTVATLREMIRKNRHGLEQVVDPLEVVPAGLGRMKIAELKIEIEKRGIPETAHRGTRESMILVIREDVAARSTFYTTSQTPKMESPSMSEGGGAPAPSQAPGIQVALPQAPWLHAIPESPDWTMAEAPNLELPRVPPRGSQ
jgi:hypothetical protein